MAYNPAIDQVGSCEPVVRGVHLAQHDPYAGQGVQHKIELEVDDDNLDIVPPSLDELVLLVHLVEYAVDRYEEGASEKQANALEVVNLCPAF